MTNWLRYGPRQYEWWRQTYTSVFDFIREFIRTEGIETALEIGGGAGYIGQWCRRYVSIDVNQTIVDIARTRGIKTICADWLTVNLCDYGIKPGDFELIIACDVIEHYPPSFDFVEKMLRLKPRWVLLSFFLGLSEKMEHEQIVRKGVALTRYSWPLFKVWLESRGLNEKWHWMGIPHPKAEGRNDEILLLECQEETR